MRPRSSEGGTSARGPAGRRAGRSGVGRGADGEVPDAVRLAVPEAVALGCIRRRREPGGTRGTPAGPSHTVLAAMGSGAGRRGALGHVVEHSVGLDLDSFARHRRARACWAPVGGDDGSPRREGRRASATVTAVVVIDARTRGAGRGGLCARGSAWGAHVANGELGPRRVDSVCRWQSCSSRRR